MKELKGIYLGACRAWHPNFNLDYNDIVPGYHCNVICDMMKVDLNCYDYIIASPPCNYYSFIEVLYVYFSMLSRKLQY